jgi:hypothetical protein
MSTRHRLTSLAFLLCHLLLISFLAVAVAAYRINIELAVLYERSSKTNKVMLLAPPKRDHFFNILRGHAKVNQ